MTELREQSEIWWRRVVRKSKGKPLTATILQTRTLSTAIEILDWIHDIPFEKLSMSLYFYCQDVGMAQFTRAYEAQLELAGANPEKFAMGLHKFFNEMSIRILKEDLFDEYFEFYYRCVKLRIRNENEQISDTVTTAYQNLLIQQLEYLRPSKFDLRTFIAGRSTTGELLIRDDLFPTFDIPIFETRLALEEGRKLNNPEEYLYERYRRAGYQIFSAEDQQIIIAEDKIHTTTCTTMLPFINEYTFDMLPQQHYNANSDIIHRIHAQISTDVLKEALTKRKRTLPTNGAKVVFSNCAPFHSVLFKELLYDNSIYMLFRLSTVNGDLCGIYETKDRFFYSIFQSSVGHNYLGEAFAALILFCYASQVIGGYYQAENIRDFITIDGCPQIIASGYAQGGKLRNVYRTEQTHIREGNYEASEATVQGYIRRLPAGQRASQEAQELAMSLGYDLESNETYVRPFTKQVFRLKEKSKRDGGQYN